jgi:protein-S-isoprenylcysteine O-methyltransferase Ste14
MKAIGKTTINPFIFYTGKICGYVLWIVLAGYILGVIPPLGIQFLPMQIFSWILVGIALIVITMSFVYLGNSVRLGLPTEETTLRVQGIYRYSRNPMYVGFNLLTIACMVYSINIVTLLMGICCLLTYHGIILGEEKFLQMRFGEEYTKYSMRVGRYI